MVMPFIGIGLPLSVGMHRWSLTSIGCFRKNKTCSRECACRDAFWGHLEVSWGPLKAFLAPFWLASRAQMHQRACWNLTGWTIINHRSILGAPVEAVSHYFLTLSLIWGMRKHVRTAGMVFNRFWMDNLLNSEITTCEKHGKYGGFH